jgi:uncharacterized protein (TIGR03083 family)
VTTEPRSEHRPALSDAVDQLLSTLAAIEGPAWDRPASDRWTVRELAAHTVRGMEVLSLYLDAALEVTGPELADAADYFRTALSSDGAHDGIAARGAAAADTAPDDLVPWAEEVAAAMLARVADTDDDAVLVHFAGWLPFDDYVVTRVTELVLHTFDLQLACGLPVQAPATALAVVNPVLVQLADRADPRALALALTGRVPPFPCNVLG